MAAEMAEIPAVLRRLLAGRTALRDALARRAPRPLAGVVLVGRGSSEHAALYGRYLLEATTGRPASLLPPSLGSVIAAADGYRGYLAVGISQSGETDDVVAALAALGRAGAVTAALTARPDSPLGALADIVVDLATGEERAVPATKTFAASLAGLALLAETLGPVPWLVPEWENVIDGLCAVLADPGPAGRAAERLHPHDTVACVARGILLPVAHEAALKLQEAALLQADAHSTVSFWHGPIAATGMDRPLLAFAGAGPFGEDTRRLAERIRLGGGRVVLVDQGPDADIPIPPGVPGALLPLVAAVRAQQIALEAALQRGLDPDHPPGLTKVTRP